MTDEDRKNCAAIETVIITPLLNMAAEYRIRAEKFWNPVKMMYWLGVASGLDSAAFMIRKHIYAK